MKDQLKAEIKSILLECLEKKIQNYDFSKKSGNPFIDIIFGDLSNLKSFIHSTATTLGDKYEIIARKIAESNPNFAEVKKYSLHGNISDNEKSMITDIVKDLEEDKKGSDYDKEIEKIYSSKNNGIKPTKIIIDLYLKDKKGKEYYIEMKGPDPNKKEVRAAKADLLNVVAIKKKEIPFQEFRNKVAIIFAVYYNNKKGKYSNWKVSPMFENKKGMLIQEEFWEFIGGPGTYLDLLEIIQETRKEISPKIKEKLKTISQYS